MAADFALYFRFLFLILDVIERVQASGSVQDREALDKLLSRLEATKARWYEPGKPVAP